MKTFIEPTVRKDGISFVDEYHFGDGSPIMKWVCGSCDWTVTECSLSDEDEDVNKATANVTLGFYGPNGNGFNYWCRKCAGRMKPTA